MIILKREKKTETEAQSWKLIYLFLFYDEHSNFNWNLSSLFSIEPFPIPSQT